MNATNKEIDYCQIEFKIRNKGEDFARSGPKLMWLIFQAQASNKNKKFLVGESSEIPISANIAGASFVPQKNMTSHVSIHQNLLQKLEEDGWELLPERGSAWWERRLCRPTQPQKSVFERLKRK